MKRHSGLLLILCGFIHAVVGIAAALAPLQHIWHYGLWNSLTQDSQAQCFESLPCLQANATWWFIAWGLMLLILGVLVHWVESRLQQAVPASLGWSLLLLSTLCAVMMPASGFWAVMVVAVYMIVLATKQNS